MLINNWPFVENEGQTFLRNMEAHESPVLHNRPLSILAVQVASHVPLTRKHL